MSWFRGRRKPEQALTLDADLRRRIRASFDAASSDEENFPSEIDPRIVHVRLILEHLAPGLSEITSRPARVLDVGCGKGRFARLVAERFPDAAVWGLDISTEMLKYAPAGVRRAAGSMTELPFPDAAFDGVYATESLEHAVEIETAVAELCRVARPGARITIIDKNLQEWGRLETPEWERWFSRRELERLLRRHCHEVSSQPLSYWEDVPPDGLFLAWLATK